MYTNYTCIIVFLSWCIFLVLHNADIDIVSLKSQCAFYNQRSILVFKYSRKVLNKYNCVTDLSKIRKNFKVKKIGILHRFSLHCNLYTQAAFMCKS